MSPLRKTFAALLSLGLAACGTAADETGASLHKMGDMVSGDHKPKPAPQVNIPPRYCYKTYEDVICYAKPIPGEEYRLVGYQSATGKTGYTLPPTHVPQDDEGDGKLPPLKSVSVGSPPAVKPDEGDKQLKEIIFDPSELEPKELVPDKPQ